MTTNLQTTSKSIEHLNALLRGELSAVETYDQVIAKFSDGPITDLMENRTCHNDRVRVLTKHITQLGGTPSTSSGSWGVLANLTQAGAKLFGLESAINALELGEDKGLDEYRTRFGHLDPASAEIVRTDLLPAQERTHRKMSRLKHDGARSPSGQDRL